MHEQILFGFILFHFRDNGQDSSFSTTQPKEQCIHPFSANLASSAMVSWPDIDFSDDFYDKTDISFLIHGVLGHMAEKVHGTGSFCVHALFYILLLHFSRVLGTA